MSQHVFKPNPEDLTVVLTPAGYIKRQVVCAANRYGEIIILGVRHHCPLMNKMLDLAGINGFTKEQGFVDQWGNFMDRVEALYIEK